MLFRSYDYLAYGPFPTMESYLTHIERLRRDSTVCHFAIRDIAPGGNGRIAGTVALLNTSAPWLSTEVGHVRRSSRISLTTAARHLPSRSKDAHRHACQCSSPQLCARLTCSGRVRASSSAVVLQRQQCAIGFGGGATGLQARRHDEMASHPAGGQERTNAGRAWARWTCSGRQVAVRKAYERAEHLLGRLDARRRARTCQVAPRAAHHS